MKFLAAVFVILAVFQVEALPTTDSNEVVFDSEDTVVHFHPNGGDIAISEGNGIEFDGIVPYHPNGGDIREEVADDQTTAHCTDPQYCDCSQLKYASPSGTNSNGERCTVFGIPYCEGVCSSNYR